MIIRFLAAVVGFVCLSACGGGAQVQTAAPATSNVVAFMGDSITQFWDLSQYDSGPTLNFGVVGNTTVQMLARFDAVIAARPGVVVILGGINDMALYDVGQISAPPDIESVKAMAAAAKAAGIKVILCSVLPVLPSYASGQLAAVSSQVDGFNQQLMELAKESGYLYADYYDAMLGDDGTQNATLFMDPVHPNAAGYAAMWAVLAPLIAEDIG